MKVNSVQSPKNGFITLLFVMFSSKFSIKYLFVGENFMIIIVTPPSFRKNPTNQVTINQK